jgi:hypothetical protein
MQAYPISARQRTVGADSGRAGKQKRTFFHKSMYFIY